MKNVFIMTNEKAESESYIRDKIHRFRLNEIFFREIYFMHLVEFKGKMFFYEYLE